MTHSMDGKVAAITGGAGSVGLASARRLLDAGAKVLLLDKDPALLTQATQALQAFGERVATLAADVSQEADNAAFVQEALHRFGRLDVLICNAGINGDIRPIAEYDAGVFDRVMAVNVRGPFLACKHALPVMTKGGSIIITSSVVGVTADPGICAYATSKHAVVGLMRVAAKEGAPRGIRVNVLAPGPIDNAFQADIERRLSHVVGTDATDMLNGKIPLGRHGRAEEIADMMLFLASDASSFSTGSIFMADGGMSI